jgi:enterochelin esterase-like enzyme
VLLALAFAGGACAPAATIGRDTNGRDPLADRVAVAPLTTATEDVREVSFTSRALQRSMPYLVYLPPGYATTVRRYPVLYMLHGMGGSDNEWRTYGLLDLADKMIRAGELTPLIIVLPQGDRSYWVDHAAGDREAWGHYMAMDVVGDVDARFRTLADAEDRAIGGDSMGAHGALQLALNYPGRFSVVGAHSLVLRRYGSAPAYFGSASDYADRDPMQLVRAKSDVVRNVDLWIDIGDKDQWAPLAEQFHQELNALKIAHVWHEWSGDHSARYWGAHLRDYLRFYGDGLAAHLRMRPARRLG